jgi:DNA ligase 1
MSDSVLLLGEQVLVKGSAKHPYVLQGHNVGQDGQHFTCSCPAWRNQGATVDMRTCKHLTKELGAEFESARIGKAVAAAPAPGAPSKAPPVILAESWDGVSDPTGMLVSEKLDGVRAYWTGSMFLSRLGNVFHAPAFFTDGLPSMVLDGELWMGRGKFQRAVSIVRTGNGDRGWNDLRYVVFDAPEIVGGFEQRIEFLLREQASWPNNFVDVLDHAVCSGHDDLQTRLDAVESQGGEGLMLRSPGSTYTSGRTTDLLKVKRFKDAEATVVDFEAGKGRHKGRVGSLICELGDGTRFKVGTGLSDTERESPPAIGSVITFRYQELTDGGVPRFPAYVRVRSDVNALGSGGSPGTTEPTPKPRIADRETVVKSTPPDASANVVVDSGAFARFEFVEGSSAKFWEIAVFEAQVTTRWGRIGTVGQSAVKSFSNEDAAGKAALKQRQEKIDKGYVPAS